GIGIYLRKSTYVSTKLNSGEMKSSSLWAARQVGKPAVLHLRQPRWQAWLVLRSPPLFCAPSQACPSTPDQLERRCRLRGRLHPLREYASLGVLASGARTCPGSPRRGK